MKLKILSIACILIFSGCAQKHEQSKVVIKDEQLPAHIKLIDLGTQSAKMLPKIQKNINFNGHWLLQKRFNVFDMKIDKNDFKDAFWAFESYKFIQNRPYYGSNFRPLSKQWFDKQRENANENAFLSLNRLAITTANTPMRNFPTSEPIFYNPQKAGEGYPFDYLQNSTLSIGFPLYVSHLSKDRAWALVKDDDVWGWVSVNDIKIISIDEAKKYKSSKFISITKDKTAIYNEYGWFLFYARIGAILPYTSEDNDNFYGEIYTRLGKQKFIAPKEVSAQFPLALNQENLNSIVDSLLNQPYGWGGVDNLRDCSLLTKDILSGFGVWLPRNSRAQSNIGEKIDLKGLGADEKIRLIKEHALPYLTLLHSPGHIMLYVGIKDDKILIFHDAWGLKLGKNGRALIGQTAITTLDIGSKIDGIDKNSLLINKIDSMNILGKNEQDTKRLPIADEPCLSSDANASYAALMPLNTPLSDAGRCRDYKFLAKTYGANEKEVKDNLIDVIWLKDFEAKKLKFNAKNGAAKALNNVSNELNELAKTNPEILPLLKDSGTFKWRLIAKTSRASAHSYGIAIDINVKNSSYWQWDTHYKNTLPPQVVHIFEKHKFIWGGRWRHFDTMHFEYRPELFKN